MTNRLKLKMNIKLTNPIKKLVNIKPARYYQVRLDKKKKILPQNNNFQIFLNDFEQTANHELLRKTD